MNRDIRIEFDVRGFVSEFVRDPHGALDEAKRNLVELGIAHARTLLLGDRTVKTVKQKRKGGR